MRETFDDALVTGWEDLEAGIFLPHSDDRHVVAAAIRANAQTIVTPNGDDFPARRSSGLREPLNLTTAQPHEAATANRSPRPQDADPPKPSSTQKSPQGRRLPRPLPQRTRPGPTDRV